MEKAGQEDDSSAYKQWIGRCTVRRARQERGSRKRNEFFLYDVYDIYDAYDVYDVYNEYGINTEWRFGRGR